MAAGSLVVSGLPGTWRTFDELEHPLRRRLGARCHLLAGRSSESRKHRFGSWRKPNLVSVLRTLLRSSRTRLLGRSLRRTPPDADPRIRPAEPFSNRAHQRQRFFRKTAPTSDQLEFL